MSDSHRLSAHTPSVAVARKEAMDSRVQRLGPAAAATAIVLSGASAAVTLQASASEHALLEAVARATMVGTPIAVGAFACRLPHFRRFGGLLIAGGVACFLASLSESPNGALYSVGRVWVWVVEVLLLYAVLAFPTGRLSGRADRLLVGALALVAVVLYLPTALLVERYPVPSPWTTCSADCPDNALIVVGSEPAFVADVVRPLRELLSVAIFAAATVLLSHRVVGASHLRRLMLTPVLAVASARVALLAATFVVRQQAPASPWLDALVWLIAIAVPAMALAFLLGLLRWRVFVAGAMRRFAGALSPHPRPEDLRTALADAFDDESLEIAYWLDDGRWGDAKGDAVELPDPSPERTFTEVWDGDRRVAAIVYDAALRDEPAFIDAATAYAVMTLDNQRLSVQAAKLLREVDRSRARIQRSADDERRRIERDLHDGAQQRLVALRIKLELAAEQIDGGSRDGDPALLRALGEEVEQALDEIRSLARGIYPAPLDRGLVEALRAAALRTALPTTVLAAGIGRYPREIESAAYFCCLEALQNVAKHAAGASAAVVELCDDGALHFEVRDDGAGYDTDAVTAGVGLISMRDRMGAVGGELAISSSPGRGTRVRGTIPLSEAERRATDLERVPRR